MDYGELRNYFKELLNRTDITETQTDLFISLGLRRTERMLRTPLQRSFVVFTVPADWDGGFGVPNDYLGFYYLKVNDLAVSRITVNAAGEGYPGSPQDFFIDRGQFKFRPTLKEGDVIDLGYYKAFAQGVSLSSITNYSEVIADIIVYAALVYAADFFTDVRKADFNNTFTTLLGEVQMMADIDEMSGGVYIHNPYAGIV